MTEAQKGNIAPQFSPREYISMKTLKELSVLKPWKSTLDIFSQYLLIGLAIFIAEYVHHWAITLLCLIFIGARLYAFGMLLHEGLHYRLSNKKKLNEWLMKLLLAWPLFINPLTFRKNHIDHHQHLHTHDDPEFARRNNTLWKFPMHPLKLSFLLLLDVTGLSLPAILFSHKGYVVTDEKKSKNKPDVVRWLYYSAIFSAITYFHLWFYFFFYWLLPFITWGNLLLRVRRISEHCGLNVSEELVSRSRTTMSIRTNVYMKIQMFFTEGLLIFCRLFLLTLIHLDYNKTSEYSKWN